ncbi:Fc.00g082570.m01.CDS01 [Cosmosporella sp. VM-42]
MKYLSMDFCALLFIAPLLCCEATAIPRDNNPATCRKTKVAILGAGVAGITAAQALINASISDFLIVDRNDYIGGRVRHTTFGKRPDGTGYTVELGANWIQGLGSPGGPENPIWTLGKKYGIQNTYSNYSSILTYDETGVNDYSDLLDTWSDMYDIAEDDAGRILTQNLQDSNARVGFALAGWQPKKNMHKQAVEWWSWDWETSWLPEESSFEFGIAGSNVTFNQFSDENNFVWDQRGFNAFVIGEANEFLTENDPRLLLETIVTKIRYSNEGVVVQLHNGDCIEAEHSICTFSLGVLQNEVVAFKPRLPRWKREAIQTFQMGTYTKIFLQFNETFWDTNTQYFLYADPNTRGYYPVFQSLDGPGFLEGSSIIFVTVVGPESYRVEQQDDEKTKAEVMEVLRTMFPEKEVPEPIAFYCPRWSQEEWAYGSYSNWPSGMTLEKHQNLRANVDRLWFAGEANSAQYFGFLQGAWFEGREVGMRIAHVLNNSGPGFMTRYEILHGTTNIKEYNAANGWPVSSFLSYA